MERNWISVKDKLPDKSGYYLVFAPTYSGGSSSGLECINGIMFSKFTVAKNGNKTWSIEVGYHKRPNCVMYWMPLPIPDEFGHIEQRTGTYRPFNVWVANDGEVRAFQYPIKN